MLYFWLYTASFLTLVLLQRAYMGAVDERRLGCMAHGRTGSVTLRWGGLGKRPRHRACGRAVRHDRGMAGHTSGTMGECRQTL